MDSEDIAKLNTPRDYSRSLYKFYLEIGEFEDMALNTIKELFGADRLHLISPLDHGYELIMPIQVAPDVIRELSHKNIGIYQLVRFAKVSGEWN